MTNLPPATSSFPCQYHSTIVHSHLHLQKSLIERSAARNLETFKQCNSLFCMGEALDRSDFAVLYCFKIQPKENTFITFEVNIMDLGRQSVNDVKIIFLTRSALGGTWKV